MRRKIRVERGRKIGGGGDGQENWAGDRVQDRAQDRTQDTAQNLSVRLGFLLNTFTMCVTKILSLSPHQKFLRKHHDGTTQSANKFLTHKKEVLGIVYMINKSLLIPETLGLALLDVNWMSSSCFSTCNMNYDANGSKLTGL